MDSTATQANRAEKNSSNSHGANGENPFGSSAKPSSTVVVSGCYAAELLCGDRISDKARAVMSKIAAVRVSDLDELNLLDGSRRPPCDDDVRAWHAHRGGIWNPPTKEIATRGDLKVALAGIDPTVERALVDIDRAAQDGQDWAAKVIRKARGRNAKAAMMGGVKNRERPVAFSPAQLLGFGVTLGVIATLPGATDESFEESVALLTQWDIERRNNANDRARAAGAALVTELPPPVSLDELLATEDAPVSFRIDQLWPADGAKVLCVAPAGGGKTTLSGNLVRALADGDPFLGAFRVNQTAQRIVIIDNEMTTDMLRRWLRLQGVVNTSAIVDVVTLRGQAGLFDMGSDRVRDRWTRRLADQGCDLVVFDCVKPVLESMGLDENREMGKLLYPMSEMMAAAGVEDVLVHHHMGHNAERSRGDSTALGWSDGNWKIVIDRDHPQQPRYFSTDKMRGADLVAEGLLTFDSRTGHLTYAGGDRKRTRADEDTEERIEAILNALADAHAEGKEELTATAIEQVVGGRKESIVTARGVAVERKLITERKQGRAKFYRLNPKALDPVFMGE